MEGRAAPYGGTLAKGDPPGHLLAAARHLHTSTTQSGEFVRIASEIILAPDWPMRFPCRLRAKKEFRLGHEAEQDLQCVLPSFAPASSIVCTLPPPSRSSCWDPSAESPEAGEKLEKAPGELEGPSQPVAVVFWRVFGLGVVLPPREEL